VPVMATIFIIGGLGAIAVPTTSGFAAEVSIFLGAFSSNAVANVHIYTIICLSGIVLAAIYMLWLIQRVFFGRVLSRFNSVADADRLERAYCTVFIIVIFLVGVYPMILTEAGISPIAAFFGG
jgi:NADH-quinone oxidoreductase subunit M